MVDGYDAYQDLDDAWGGVAIDLEIIQTEGFDAVRKVDPNMVLKKKKNEEVEVQEGWVGHVLPFDLVQRHLLAADMDAVAKQAARIGAIDQELAEILENMGEDDKGSTDAIDEDGAFVSAELTRVVKAIGKHPEGAFECALVQAKRLIDEQKDVRKRVKEARFALEEKTCATIEALTDEQCRDLLAAKWIDPLMVELCKLPYAVVDGFIAQVCALNDKYATTYSDVCRQIDEAERELAGMLDQLCGNEFDMAGIAELKNLLGGE